MRTLPVLLVLLMLLVPLEVVVVPLVVVVVVVLLVRAWVLPLAGVGGEAVRRRMTSGSTCGGRMSGMWAREGSLCAATHAAMRR